MTNVVNKSLPWDEQAQKTMIATIILDNSYAEHILDHCKPEHFYGPYYKTIMKAVETLHHQGLGINPISINSTIKEHTGQELALGVVGLANMTMGVPFLPVKDIVEMAEKCREKSVARGIIRLCNEVTADLMAEDGKPVKEIAEKAETGILARVTELSKTGTEDRPDFYSLAEIAPSLREQFENYNKGVSTGVKTGFGEVDEKLDGGGLQNKGLYLIAAGEKSGKTSLALDWCYHISAVEGYESDILTAEMAKETLAKRIFSAHTGIPYSQFRPGFYGSNYLRAIKELDAFSKIPIRIADRINTVEKAKRAFRNRVEQAHRNKKKYGLGVVDYVQLIELDDSNTKYVGRVETVSQVSREFKKLANDLDIPLVAMSSLNRVGLTEGQRPDTFNLRETGQLAYDAEAIFFLHNPAYVPGKPYVPKQVTEIDLILARQRNGPTGDIKLKFVGPYMQFMTDTQYEKYLAMSANKDLPLSTGQVIQKEEDYKDLWDNS